LGARAEGSADRAAIDTQITNTSNIRTYVGRKVLADVRTQLSSACARAAASSRDLIAPAEACLAMAAIRMIARLTQSCIIAKQNWPNELAKQT